MPQADSFTIRLAFLCHFMFCKYFLANDPDTVPQRSHDVEMTSYRRRCDVMCRLGLLLGKAIRCLRTENRRLCRIDGWMTFELGTARSVGQRLTH